jgi:hypothetical protein
MSSGDRGLETEGLSDREVLEGFLIDNPDFERLELLLGEFNLFEALGVTRQELRHSDFLGFLLDPRANHGLSDSFLTLFLRKAVRGSDPADLPFSAIDVTLWDLADTEIRREWHDIDLLIVNRANKFVIVIENKIGSGEHSDQLSRYIKVAAHEFPGWSVAGIYLTPDGQSPSDESYIPCSYGLVNEAIQALLLSRTAAMGEEVQAAVRHYSQLLQRHVVSESEIAELCQRIYRKHRKALDLIYEHRPDKAALIHDILVRHLGGRASVRLDHSSKGYIRFIPTEWDLPQLKGGTGWTSSGRILLFEFKNEQRGTVLQLELGPGPKPTREAIFQRAMDSPLLSPSSKGLNLKWNAIYPGRIVLTAATIEALDEEELETRLTEFWESFEADELPKFVEELLPVIQSLPVPEEAVRRKMESNP